MPLNQITVTIEECECDGYNVLYRPLVSSIPYRNAGFFTESPIQFTDNLDAEGTQYEGMVISRCGLVDGPAVPWATAGEEITWQGINAYCETVKSCAEGYSLNDDESLCVKETTTAATPPSGEGGTPGVAEHVTSTAWNRGGARVYLPGYPDTGEGVLDEYLTQTPLFVNGDTPFGSGNDTIKSRMNAAGVWVVGGAPVNEYIGFSRKITVAVAKTVYVAMAADNAFRFVLNGNVLVDCTSGNIAGGPNFNFLHIYPIDLIAGDNYVELYGVNFGSVAGMVAEIYDNTLAELMSAAVEGDLNILFSTKDMFGEEFNLGETVGYSCPIDYSYDPDSGLCVKIETQAPIVDNTGMLAYADRERLVNGVPDGYQEPNIDGEPIGPYIEPIENLDLCPI